MIVKNVFVIGMFMMISREIDEIKVMFFSFCSERMVIMNFKNNVFVLFK